MPNSLADNRAMHKIDLWNFFNMTMPVWSPFASGFVAALTVHLLTQSRERERWILDCKKQEYRELLDALSNLFVTCIAARGGYIGEEGRLHSQAGMHFTRIVRDRLYITPDLALQELEDEWGIAQAQYSKTKSVDELLKAYTIINRRIVAAANRSVPKSSIQRLVFWKR